MHCAGALCNNNTSNPSASLRARTVTARLAFKSVQSELRQVSNTRASSLVRAHALAHTHPHDRRTAPSPSTWRFVLPNELGTGTTTADRVNSKTMVVRRHGYLGSAVGAGSGRDGAGCGRSSCVEIQHKQKEKCEWAGAAEHGCGRPRAGHPTSVDLI